ncbi:MAG TPA: serine hydrolase [Acidobacteriota bacterium]|nr:serine hydrolase [Acidobacteriota bacterium]
MPRDKRALIAIILAVAVLRQIEACTPSSFGPFRSGSQPAEEAGEPETPWPTLGWVLSSPEQEGMDSALLEQASKYVKDQCPTRFSLLVVRNGRLVLERYYNGSNAYQPNNIKSMSKSVLSVLTGIALDEGLLTGVDQRLDEFFPEYFSPGDDPRKHDITLEHLLTMTAGFEWGENGPTTVQWVNSSDWHAFTIRSRLTSTPGEVFNYNTALTHLLSGILTRVSGTSTRDFATSRLFAPLGMTCSRWDRDPRGYYFGGSEVWLTPRDLAKFALLCLRQGRWEDRQVVSEQWLRDSFRLRVRTGAELGDYSYLWWKMTMRGYPVTLASGYGGQNIFLVPDLDLAMVTTAKSDIQTVYQHYKNPYDLLSRYVIPAVKANPPFIHPGGVGHLPDHGPRLAPGVFASVSGGDFSLVESTWEDAMPADGRLPEGIGGVRIYLGGRVAYPSLVRNQEIQFLVPPDMATGTHTLEIRTPQGKATRDVEVAEFAPAVFTRLRDGRSWASLEKVRPGAVVELQASGLGPSIPPAPVGTVFDSPRPLAHLPRAFVAGRPAEVVSSALASPGVWAVKIRIPLGVPVGPVNVQLRAGGNLSQGEALIEIVSSARQRRWRSHD